MTKKSSVSTSKKEWLTPLMDRLLLNARRRERLDALNRIALRSEFWDNYVKNLKPSKIRIMKLKIASEDQVLDVKDLKSKSTQQTVDVIIHEFTAKEMAELKDLLSQLVIQRMYRDEVAAEFKNIVHSGMDVEYIGECIDKINLVVLEAHEVISYKDLVNKIDTIAGKIKAGGEERQHFRYHVPYHDLDVVGLYDELGLIVSERPMRPDERQLEIFNVC